MDISQRRSSYRRMSLDEADAHPDALAQFHRWFEETLAAEVPEANAMTLATASPDGRPSARMVLLKSYEHGRFLFYTNYESRKARELASNPYAALILYWQELERQVRIEGKVERATDAESDAYFATRPRGSQLGAWASKQSEALSSKTLAYGKVAITAARFGLGAIPRPPFWGGYALLPDTLEFWQGRPNRFHDRLRYRKQPDGGWLRERLWP
jgi:pyridoxamine 5'-phosphate oxidase